MRNLSKMKIICSLSLALSIVLFPDKLEADDAVAGNAALAAKEAKEALVGHADTKLAAALRMAVTDGPTRDWEHRGAFISKDGLALIDARGLFLWQKEPIVHTANGTLLKFGSILEVFPQQGLALVKFNYSPKVYLDFAEDEPALGEATALLGWEGHRERHILDTKAPPVVGPIMEKRHERTGDRREFGFTRILSLGSGLTDRQQRGVSQGNFAIDRRGNLVAFFNSQRRYGNQTIIQLTPVVALADLVRQAVKERRVIPFPLPEDKNPYHTLLGDPTYNRIIQSRVKGDRLESRRLLKVLLIRHPMNYHLKFLALEFYDREEPLVGLKDFPEPDQADPAALQVALLGARAFLFIEDEKVELAIQALKDAVALSPKDYPQDRYRLARLYFDLGRLEDSQRSMIQAYASWSDRIGLVEAYERLLIRQSKFKEARELTKRVYELEKIYRWW